LSELLPSAFGPRDLGLTQGALPIKKVNLALSRRANDPVTALALAAASSSYAPYTKAYSGVAIRCADGSLHTGSYIENAAFNPSLAPLEVALIRLIVSNKKFS